MRYSIVSPYREYVREIPSSNVDDKESVYRDHHVSCVDMTDGLLHTMGLSDGCQLYALPMVDGNRALILTCFPYELWDSLYRITMHIADQPGSLAHASQIVSDHKINILASWAAATTSSGEGCWTAIVSIADANSRDIESIRCDVKSELEKASLSSTLPQFESSKGFAVMEIVTVEPLEVLPALKKVDGVNAERPFRGTISDCQIDFRTFFTRGHDLYSCFIEPYVKHNGIPTYFLLTPDPHEGYFSVCPIRSYEFLQFIVNYEVDSPDPIFEGYFTTILRALQELGMRLFSAKNFLLEKGERERDGVVRHVERVRHEFIVDMERDAPPNTDYRKLESVIEYTLTCALKGKADSEGKSLGGGPKVQVRNADTFYSRCFLSTNARELDECERVVKLIHQLRSIHLEPVNVDIVMRTDRFIYSEAVQLLDASCIVVSLHFPVRENMLSRTPNRRNTRVNDEADKFCPSDWILFEEAYALANSKGVFRMLQKGVRLPRYAFGQRVFDFKKGDEDDFDKKVAELLVSIKRYRQTDDYRKAHAISSGHAKDVSPALLDRDIEQVYQRRIDEIVSERERMEQRHRRSPDAD